MIRDAFRRWLGISTNTVSLEILLAAIDADRKLHTAQFTALMSLATTQNRALARILTRIDPDNAASEIARTISDDTFPS